MGLKDTRDAAIYLFECSTEAEADRGERRLRQWRYEARGPRYVKLGRAVAYRTEDLDAWIAGHVHDPERDRATAAA
mgnify:CR=1 FL=1